MNKNGLTSKLNVKGELPMTFKTKLLTVIAALLPVAVFSVPGDPNQSVVGTVDAKLLPGAMEVALGT